VACSIAANWLFNWAIGYATPYLVDSGPGSAGLKAKVFFIWGTCCFGCVLFVYFCIFETKGLTLEQVDDMYEHCDKAWQSKSFVPTVRFEEEVRKGSVVQTDDVEKFRASIAERRSSVTSA
jgi:SP family sugar:H+ symporter-like MFS transporter